MAEAASTELVPVSKPRRKVGGKKTVEIVTLNGVTLDEPTSRAYHYLNDRLREGERIEWRRGGLWIALPPGEVTDGDNRVALAAAALEEDRVRNQMVNAVTREAFNRGFSQAAALHTHKMLMVDISILDRAMDPDASAQDKKMALQVTQRWMDRMGGKAIAPTEQVQGAGSIVDRFARRGGVA